MTPLLSPLPPYSKTLKEPTMSSSSARMKRLIKRLFGWEFAIQISRKSRAALILEIRSSPPAATLFRMARKLKLKSQAPGERKRLTKTKKTRGKARRRTKRDQQRN